MSEARKVAARSGADLQQSLTGVLESAVADLSETIDDENVVELLNGAMDLWRERVTVELSHDDPDLRFGFSTGNAGVCLRRLGATPPFGAPDRVSTTEFFSPDASLSTLDLPDGEADEYRDSIYLAAVAGLVTLREYMFGHARRVDAFGPSGRAGAEAVTIVGLVLILIGGTLVVTGVIKLANGDSSGWGLIISGALLIAAGACALAGLCPVLKGTGGLDVQIGRAEW